MKKVLVVDDEENICIMLKDLLERFGFVVFFSLKTQEALKIFEEKKPEVCILDMHMPFSEFSGLELLEKIKKISPTTNCIVFSRVEDKEVIEKAKKLGATDYLIKPLDLERIQSFIEKIK